VKEKTAVKYSSGWTMETPTLGKNSCTAQALTADQADQKKNLNRRHFLEKN
jgi:hypothetical protein